MSIGSAKQRRRGILPNQGVLELLLLGWIHVRNVHIAIHHLLSHVWRAYDHQKAQRCNVGLDRLDRDSSNHRNCILDLLILLWQNHFSRNTKDCDCSYKCLVVF